MDRDLERGDWSPEKNRISDEEYSVDGYDYDGHKSSGRGTFEFRLPWTGRMNNSIKNRKFLFIH